jgi:drug/metabolite transporter (DMT)-like permease
MFDHRSARSALGLALGTIYLVWGSTYLAIRVAVSSIPPFAMAAARFLLAGGLLFLFLRWRGAPQTTLRQWIDNTIIGILLLLGGNGLVVWAEQAIPSGMAALLIGAGPIFIVLTDWAWPGGERPTALTAAALLLGLGGVAWLAAPWESVGAGALPRAEVAVVLLACVFWAVGSIYSRYARGGAQPFMAAAQQMLGGGGALVAVSLATGEAGRLDLAAITPQSWLAFAYLVGVGSLVGFSTFVWLMKNARPAVAATYAYINPIVAVFLGWLLLDEPVTARTFVAAAIIIASVLIITVQRNRRRLAVPPRQAVVPAGIAPPRFKP